MLLPESAVDRVFDWPIRGKMFIHVAHSAKKVDSGGQDRRIH